MTLVGGAWSLIAVVCAADDGIGGCDCAVDYGPRVSISIGGCTCRSFNILVFVCHRWQGVNGTAIAFMIHGMIDRLFTRRSSYQDKSNPFVPMCIAAYDDEQCEFAKAAFKGSARREMPIPLLAVRLCLPN